MKCVSVRPTLLVSAPLLFTSLIALTGCGSHSVAPAPPITLTVAPQPASVPVNGTVAFTATTNAPASAVSWGILGDSPTPANPNGTVNLGGPRNQTGGTTYTYTAPPTPPVYQDPLAAPGTINIRVIAIGDSSVVQFNLAITAPTVSTGFMSTTNTVALGKTLIITGYAVGSTNNAIAMQVNGVTGGSTTYGTIAQGTGALYGNFTYTAPATMPMTGNTVTVTVVSQADPTKSSSRVVTLTPS